MLLEVLGLDVHVSCHGHLFVEVLVLLLVALLPEEDLWLTRAVDVPWRRTYFGQSLLVPFIRFRQPNNSARQLDGVTVMNHVLSCAPVQSHEYPNVEPSPIGHVGQWLVASVLVATRLAKG